VLKLIKQIDYKNASAILQRIESNLVVSTVSKSLVGQGVPIITIHDCIFTTPDYVDLVKWELQNELLKIAGFKPQVRIES